MTSSSSLTKNQKLVLDALEKEKGPLSAYSILDRLRDDGLRAPLQVYRALDKLLDLQLVHRLESLNAFVACAHPHCHASHMIAFGICETCGQVWEFSDDVVRDRLMGWAESHDFKPSKTTIEMKGVCADCRAAG
ncbi:Fur family transcriptional regulator [Consotaella salsifontis]|uniref:Fur family transcriptional regulator, zinc uptake regulator n=1 Tax=Consotaella salsifontis TaxID=1365950 RepID=A0A1T4P9V0_9HYPH|nr:Fur family transcriptional regulator [Consotaella salsifontis]SJZ88107.1 Fur family transcriptional regulator, zinc uptake regulator [Consotaella salsifontis]